MTFDLLFSTMLSWASSCRSGLYTVILLECLTYCLSHGNGLDTRLLGCLANAVAVDLATQMSHSSLLLCVALDKRVQGHTATALSIATSLHCLPSLTWASGAQTCILATMYPPVCQQAHLHEILRN